MKHIKEYEELTDFTRDIFGLDLYLRMEVQMDEIQGDVYHRQFEEKIRLLGIDIEILKREKRGYSFLRFYKLKTGLGIEDIVNTFPLLSIKRCRPENCPIIDLVVLEKDLETEVNLENTYHLLCCRNKIYRPE